MFVDVCGSYVLMLELLLNLVNRINMSMLDSFEPSSTTAETLYFSLLVGLDPEHMIHICSC